MWSNTMINRNFFRNFLLTLVFITTYLSMNLMAGTGVPVMSLSTQIPIHVLFSESKNKLVPEIIAIPYSIGADIGYIYKINKVHSVLGMYNIGFEEDPSAGIASSEGVGKIPVSTYSTRSLYNFLTLGHKFSLNDFANLDSTLSIGLTFLNTGGGKFSEGLYNNTTPGAKVKFAVPVLAAIPNVLDLKILKTSGASASFEYKYNQFPNYAKAENLLTDFENEEGVESKASYPQFNSFSGALELKSKPLPEVVASLQYQLSGDFYVNNKITDSKGKVLDENERTSKNKISARVSYTPKQIPNQFLGLSLAIDEVIFRSTAIEKVTATKPELLVNLDPSIYYNPSIPFSVPVFFPQYKDYNLFIINPKATFQISENKSFFAEYTFGRKNYLGKYATFSEGESQDFEVKTYKKELEIQQFQTVIAGFVLNNKDAMKTVTPYLGFQKINSLTKEDSRTRLFVAVKISQSL